MSFFPSEGKALSSAPLLAALSTLKKQKTKKLKTATTHPQLFATRLIPSVAFFVNTISLSLAALMKRPTFARAFS